VPLVSHEVQVLHAVGEHLPLLVPTPSYVGEPDVDLGWPWPWTLVPWFGGERADLAYPPAAPDEHAVALGSFVRALHMPASADAPVNPLRGVPLRERADRTERSLTEVEAAVWLHGDLHPGNQVVVDGALAAIVDWGDATAGDPACDIATAWWTLPVSAHPTFRAAYGGVDEQTWARGRGWAAAIAVVVLADGVKAGDPAIVAMGHRTVGRFVEAAGR
jgi:aminoglycoside phosphotransferase (APT) family kinase protein